MKKFYLQNLTVDRLVIQPITKLTKGGVLLERNTSSRVSLKQREQIDQTDKRGHFYTVLYMAVGRYTFQYGQCNRLFEFNI
jgi:hypothetical protein